MNWILGTGLAGAIALIAYQMRLLTAGGALAAVLIGATVFAVGGVWASVPMIAFFFASSMLPRALGHPHQTEQRTARQVLANGLAPTLCCWGILLYPERETGFWLGYAASLAAASADTWATEFGMCYTDTAWHLTTGRRVPKGTSGAISIIGTAGGAMGATIVGGLALPLLPHTSHTLIVCSLGVGGMLLDSLLGATLQAHYRCTSCGVEGEQRTCCDAPATLVRGVRWVDNDMVNLLSTLTAAAVGVAIG
ncbi:MAG: DUF92 domain-containing protein [Armatimonadota bacterium]|nr:DUF92 domain-containing protein [Armatimonadota bacterium]